MKSPPKNVGPPSSSDEAEEEEEAEADCCCGSLFLPLTLLPFMRAPEGEEGALAVLLPLYEWGGWVGGQQAGDGWGPRACVCASINQSLPRERENACLAFVVVALVHPPWELR